MKAKLIDYLEVTENIDSDKVIRVLDDDTGTVIEGTVNDVRNCYFLNHYCGKFDELTVKHIENSEIPCFVI